MAGLTPGWRKSSYSISSGGTNCIETGTTPGRILIRDTTQQGNGPVLAISPADWRRLTADIRANTATG